MADLSTITGASGNIDVLTDEVTDGTLGTGKKQLVGIVDATINGTNKLAVSAAGGASVEIADGKDVASGAKADAVYADNTGAAAGSKIALLKALFVRLASALLIDVTKIGGTAVSVNNGVVGNGVQRVTLASDSTGQVALASAAATAKGTQGANGIPVQELHDAGRSNINLSVEAYNVASVSDTAINTFQTSVDDGAAVTGLTDYTVTAGKKFRITAISVHCASTTGNTTGGVGYVRIRTSSGAAISTSSPVQFSIPFQLSASATSSNNAGQIPLEDTWEIAAGHRIGASVIFPPYVVTTSAPKVTINISGYEY